MSSGCPTAEPHRSRSSLPQTRTKRGDETSNRAKGSSNTGDGSSQSKVGDGSLFKESPSAVIVAARPADIVCGRGLHIMNRHGNLNLHLLASRHRKTYLSSTRRDKAAIANRIVQEIKSTGARFLRRFDGDEADDDRWVEVDDKTAYKKVSHALRLRDHGKHFSKSIETQEKMNNNTIATPREAIPTPIQLGAALLPQHYDSGNFGFGISPPLSSLAGLGFPYSLPPEYQLQSIPIQPPPQLDYARLRAQTQPLQVVSPLYNTNSCISALDPLVVANAFGATLAVLNQTMHPDLRSRFEGSNTGSSQYSTGSNLEERQRHGRI